MATIAIATFLVGIALVTEVASVSIGHDELQSSHGSRRLLQNSGVKVIIPVYQDQSPCVAFNADDASPLVDKENAPLGWATVRQGSVNSTNGLATLQVDLTAHVAGLFIADSSLSQPDGSNVRTCVLTEKPDSCPATSLFMYHKGDVADCSKRRATLEVPIPLHIFNCTYNTTINYTRTFYLQVEADLASQQCSPPEGTFYAGSVSRAISRGCTYITVEAACMPQSCDPPVTTDDLTAAAPATTSQSRNLLPLVIGVSVGSGVLVIALLGGVLYLRKRIRDAALRHKYSDGGFYEYDSEPLTTDDESSYELDFSSHSTAMFSGHNHHHASGASVTSATNARGSAFLGRASTLFSRAPHNRHASVGALSSVVLPDFPTTTSGVMSGTWLPMSPTGSPSAVMRPAGAARFSDKYSEPTPFSSSAAATAAAAAAGSAAPAVPTASGSTSGGGAGDGEGPSVRGGGASGMGAGITYNNAAYNASLTMFQSQLSETVSVAGGGAAAARVASYSPGAHVERTEESMNANYHLSRLSSRLGHGYGGASASTASASAFPSPAGLRGRSSVLPPPAPVMSPSSSARRGSVVDMGFGAGAGVGPSSIFAGGASIRLGGGGGVAGGPAADLSDPQAVPEDACAFINPLAMLADSSEDDSSAAENEYMSRTAMSGRGGGAGGAGMGGLPLRSGSVMAGARAPPPAWAGIVRNAAAAPPAAFPQNRQSSVFLPYPPAEEEEDEVELVTSPARRRSVVIGPGYSGAVHPSMSLAAAAQAPSAAPAAAGPSTLVIPTLASTTPAGPEAATTVPPRR